VTVHVVVITVPSTRDDDVGLLPDGPHQYEEHDDTNGDRRRRGRALALSPPPSRAPPSSPSHTESGEVARASAIARRQLAGTSPRPMLLNLASSLLTRFGDKKTAMAMRAERGGGARRRRSLDHDPPGKLSRASGRCELRRRRRGRLLPIYGGGTADVHLAVHRLAPPTAADPQRSSHRDDDQHPRRPAED
jgi:hypothetical protein